jgi:hypothetical protein
MSIEYNPNSNDNNDGVNNINNKISSVIKLFLKRVEQNVPNVSIRLFGSITNSNCCRSIMKTVCR